MTNIQKRDNIIDILKGIGILLVVIGHSGCPKLLSDIIYSFHMPLFFIASGWFFSSKWLGRKKEYTLNKIRSLYIPFVKWCVIFLLLHNIFFYLGIINESYGTSFGEKNELLSLKEMIIRFFGIILQMRGYDGLLGAYWFIRSLFVGCLLLCFTSWLLNKIVKRTELCIYISGCLFSIVGGALLYYNISIPYWPQGGYREMMAIFFISIGFALKKCKFNTIIYCASILVFCLVFYYHPSSMNQSAEFIDWYTIIISGTCGYIIMYAISLFINSHMKNIAKLLAYLGRESFYILTFHMLMFKPFSFLIAYMNNLDWRIVGCYPVVWMIRENWYWIAYTISSVILSVCTAIFISIIRGKFSYYYK